LPPRPKNSAFSAVSGTSRVNPSTVSTRSPAWNTPGVSAVPAGTAVRAKSSLNGSAPSLAFALVIDPVQGACQSPQPAPSSACASANFESTNPYPDRMNNQHANVNTIINRAGNRRYRASRTPAASITSSSTDGGNVRASTPMEIRSGNRSCAALASRVTPATAVNYTNVS